MEYILHEVQEPHLFVIRKQKREGPDKVSAQAAYYVLDGSIYQAPQLYNVIGSRVVSPYSSLPNIKRTFIMREIRRRCSTLQMSQNWLKDASTSESYWFLKFVKDKLLGCITKRSLLMQ